MPLTEIASDLWITNQPLQFLSLEVGSRMSVVRLPNQDLILISPIELDEQDYQALNKLGPVRHIIAPNLFHHLSIGSAKALYPEAKVWGVEGLITKRPNIAFDALLTQPGSFETFWIIFNFKALQPFCPEEFNRRKKQFFTIGPAIRSSSRISLSISIKPVPSGHVLQPDF